MKNWSTTTKILAIVVAAIIIVLAFTGIQKYNKEKKEAELKRSANRIVQAMAERKSAEAVSGEELTAAIRENLAKQPVSEISAKFYKPQ